MTDSPQALYLKDYKVSAYHINSTDLCFQLFDDYTLVHSKLLIKQNHEYNNIDDSLPWLKLDGKELQLQSIVIDGQTLDKTQYQIDDESLTIKPNKREFILEISTKIKPQNNTSLEGLYVSNNMYCTQCEAHGFRRITYYLDRPDVMSKFTTRIEADKNNFPVLLSNGNLVDQGDLENGRHFATWNDPFKKPCYLFALVAGDLAHKSDVFITASGRKVDIKIYVDEKDLNQVDHAISSLKSAMAWDEKRFNCEYDLDIYMIVAVSHFNMGAMENKGLNIFNTACVLAHRSTTTDVGFQRVEGVIAHEYFHNWSGNRVTCRDWFQLSLKEGFTVFRDEEFSSDMNSRTVKRIDDVSIMRNYQFKQDAGPMAHAVRPDSVIEMNNFYTVTIYNKGAEVVRMIQTLIGVEQFKQACALYFERFDGQAVTCDDFVSCMEEVSKLDLTQFKLWYSQSGTPLVKVDLSYDEKNKTLTLLCCQSCPATPGQENKESFVIPIKIAFFDPQGEKQQLQLNGEKHLKHEHLLTLSKEQQQFVFSNCHQLPVPSILRGFSAPIRLQYDYRSSDLSCLMANDDDGFSAWEASQRLAEQSIFKLIDTIDQQASWQLDDELVNAYRLVLSNIDLDPALAARLLSLPEKTFIAFQCEVIDPYAISTAYRFVQKELACRLSREFSNAYRRNFVKESYQACSQQFAKRSMRNVCLACLVKTEEKKFYNLALKQIKEADNMTDEAAALRFLFSSEASFADEEMSAFYERYKKYDLVVDMWLSIMASSQRGNTLARVKSLLNHEAFELTNPNKLRALIGAYCQNFDDFHHASGQAYQFLADMIIKLDEINSQMAARLLEPLINWRRYENNRGQLMKQELNKIASQSALSNDVFELISKALA